MGSTTASSLGGIYPAIMNKALGSEDGTAAYIRDFVTSYHDIDSYLDMIGRDKIAELRNSTTSFLLDPYRRWILPPDEVAAWKERDPIARYAALLMDRGELDDDPVVFAIKDPTSWLLGLIVVGCFVGAVL